MKKDKNVINLLEENCKKHTGYIVDHWLKFAGIVKAQPEFKIEKCSRFEIFYYKDDDLIEIKIRNKCFNALYVEIDLMSKEITISLVITNEQYIRNVAFNLTIGVYEHALLNGYSKINLFAARGGIFVGARIWGGVGFLPVEKMAQEALSKVLLKFNKKYEKQIREGTTQKAEDLNDLKHSLKGLDMWEDALIQNGMSDGWLGVFLVDPNLQSVKILEKEKLRKKGN